MLPKVVPLDRSTTTQVSTKSQCGDTLLLKQDSSKHVNGSLATTSDKIIAKTLHKRRSFEYDRRKPVQILRSSSLHLESP